jgi:hypothetical protein
MKNDGSAEIEANGLSENLLALAPFAQTSAEGRARLRKGCIHLAHQLVDRTKTEPTIDQRWFRRCAANGKVDRNRPQPATRGCLGSSGPIARGATAAPTAKPVRRREVSS